MVFLFGQFSINVEQIINIYRIFYKLSKVIYSISQKYSFLFKKLKVEIKNFIKVIRDVVLIILNHFQPSFLQNYYIFPFHVEPNLCAPNMPCTNQEVEQWGFPIIIPSITIIIIVKRKSRRSPDQLQLHTPNSKLQTPNS